MARMNLRMLVKAILVVIALASINPGFGPGLQHGLFASSVHAADCGYDDPNNPYNNSIGQGQCTWWAWERRYQDGERLPVWGNAQDWTAGAQRDGWPTGTEPRAGAVVVWPAGVGGAGSVGHVGYVEEVFSATSYRVSEMNWNGNWCIPTERTVELEAGTSFIYRKSTPQPSPLRNGDF